MRQRGFTLIELIVTVAILAIIAAIAIPAYNNYIRESRLSTMRMNLDTLRIAVEAFRLDSRNSNYGPNTPDVFEWDESAGKATIDTQYGWRPEGGDKSYAYTVNPTSQATPIFSLWVVDKTKKLGMRCDKVITTAPATTYRCCERTDTTVTTACP